MTTAETLGKQFNLNNPKPVATELGISTAETQRTWVRQARIDEWQWLDTIAGVARS